MGRLAHFAVLLQISNLLELSVLRDVSELPMRWAPTKPGSCSA